MSTSGEIAAIGGYYKQYDIAAWEIYSSLIAEKLEWVHLAAKDVENLDDILIGRKDKILAYQVKDRSSSFTYGSLINSEDNLLKKMFSGWNKLKAQYPQKIIDVRLLTTQPISEHDSIKSYSGRKKPNFKQFLDKYWGKIKLDQAIPISWNDVTKELMELLDCNQNELFEFIGTTHLSFNYSLPKEEDFNAVKWNRIRQDTGLIRHFIFDTVGEKKKTLLLDVKEFLSSTGLRRRLQTYFQHDFFVDEKHYQPIQKSINQLNELTEKFDKGYIALIGSAGSGKSTLLSKWLQQSNDRVLKYFSYVNQDMTYDAGYRGESKYFLHDLITQIRVAQPEYSDALPGEDRIELASQLREELSRFSRDYKNDGIKTFIIVDGLDHVEREQNVEYSLIKDLPTPDATPEGIYFILGSRTIDGLRDLNPNIKLNIDNEERAIHIAPLDKHEVFNIVKSYLQPSLTEQQLENISLNTQGHPLFLRYTIERLLLASENQFNIIIENQIFTGNILDEYQKFWLSIETEEELKRLLSIIARFRFSFIDLELLETSFDFADPTLNKFLLRTRHFFYEPETTKWQYFHNSFKWFLEEWTAKAPLTGRFNSAKDEEIHSEIAQRIQHSQSHYKWNIIYHLFKAKHYSKILPLATQDYFRQQWYQFRNHKFINDDIAIAAQAAYHEHDVVAWFRYLLCSSELGQRLIDFDPSDYFDLYLDLGLQDVADSYIFNGRELLVSKGKALDYAYQLILKGEKEHSRKIFELAEPVYILYQSKEIDRNRHNPELYTQIDEIELIKKWALVAIYFQPLHEIFPLLKQLRVIDSHNYRSEDEEKFSEKLKLEMLAEAYTAIAETLIEEEDWSRLIECINQIQKDIGNGWTLLNVISLIFFNVSNKNQSVSDYNTGLIDSWKESPYPEINMQICLIYTYILKDHAKAKNYFDKLPKPKWKKDEDMYRKAIFNYLFDYTRLYYILSKNFETSIEEFIPEEKDEEVQVSDRQVCSIARFYALFYNGQQAVLNDITVHLANILNFYHKGFLELDYKVRELKSDLLDLIIKLCRLTSPEFYQKVLDLITNDWREFFKYWNVDEIRTIINTVTDDKAYINWGIEELAFLENKMLEGKRIGDRAEQCIKQARSWRRLEKLEMAEKNLKEAFKQTIGVRGEKDYQLDHLIEWLPKVNQLQPDRIQERLAWYLRRFDYIQDTTSHAHSYPALKVLRICLEWHPGNGLGLFKWLFLNRLIRFSESFEEVLEFLTEKDKANIKLYSKLFTRILLFFQDNGNYGYHISRNLVNGLLEIESIKNVVNDVQVFGIEEKKNEVIQRIIEACENQHIDIGLSKKNFPVEDRYTSSDTYKSLHLDTGESFTPKEALGMIKTVDQALELMQKESENSHFDWTEVISNLKSLLTEEKLRSFLTLKFDSVKLAKIGTIAFEAGYNSLAKEIGYEALSKSRNSGWLRHYDGGSKLKPYQLLMQVDDKKKISDLAFRDLSFSLKEIDDKRVVEEIFPILEILSADSDVSKFYEEVEFYTKELMSGATINEKIFDFNEEFIDINILVARLMIFLYEFPVSQMKEHLEAIAIESCEESSTVVDHFLEQLYECAFFESYLTILYGIFNNGNSIETRHIERLENLLNSDRFDVMYLSHQLLRDLGKKPELKFTRTNLHLVYEMEFDKKPELIVDEKTRIKEIERRRALRETNDPLEYIMFYKIEAKWISTNSGIPDINIAYRIMQIAEKENLPEWYNFISEQQLAGLFKSVDMNMPYIRPRVLRLWPALMKVLSEVWKSGYLPFGVAQRIAKQIDPRLYTITILQRIPEIEHLTETTNDAFRRRGANEEWVNKMDQSCFDKFLKIAGSQCILGELSFIKSLDDGRATEIRQSFFSLNEDFDKENYYIFEGSLHNNYVSEYPTLGENELVLFNYCRTIDTRKQWLAINPKICILAGWTLSKNGNFRWVDSLGNIMIESIYWGDGNCDNHERLLYSESGYGWYIKAVPEVIQVIRSVTNKHLYLHQKCIRKYRLYQKRYNTDIDAEKQFFNSVKYDQ